MLSREQITAGEVSACICRRKEAREQQKHCTARHHARRNLPSSQSVEMLDPKSKSFTSNQQTVYIGGGRKSRLTLDSITVRVWFKAPFSYNREKTH
ncbi:hypothetical protein CHARACLAT_023761 [Characodon lateralis]|uniref:Uncharacterized protein n=1 Tax=Characodon lateralis TaxID=208331 RepID=A0ABU7F810_9TELE|nr:hypothetical protein [Characodon lateralis]